LFACGWLSGIFAERKKRRRKKRRRKKRRRIAVGFGTQQQPSQSEASNASWVWDVAGKWARS
jgi:hypothetical protein